MRALAEVARSIVVTRVSRRGEGLDDAALTPYATRPRIYVYRAYGSGARLAPKGGRTVSIVKGVDGKFRKLKGHAYEGGYAEYRSSSKKGGGIVDLTLSEQMLQDFKVKDSTDTTAVLGLTATVDYGRHVNARRPWIGLSKGDIRLLSASLSDQINRNLGGSGGTPPRSSLARKTFGA
jgi:hypothetical protein